MASLEAIAYRFARDAGKPDAKMLSSNRSNIMTSHDNRELWSYGSHFTLARIMLDKNGERAWWLLNGDSYSVSTTRHQSITRDAVSGTGLPYMIVSFTALREAGITGLDTITVIDVQKDRTERTTHVVATREEVPQHHYARELPDGRFEYETYRHWLGESVFKASYGRLSSRYSTRQDYAGRDYRYQATITETAYFLSAFDENEPRPLYFLAQLPKDARPATVTEAREALKPTVVQLAEADGRAVLRQGDVFAVEAAAGEVPSDKEIKTRAGASAIKRMDYVLGVNHTATRSATLGGHTYARGILRHKPRETWRRPEHRTVKLGDGKTWHRVVKNTVPEGRSWSRGGAVD